MSQEIRPAWNDRISTDGYDAFAPYHEAVITFSRRLVMEFGDPAEAMDELQRMGIVCPVFAESTAELVDDIILFLKSQAVRQIGSRLYGYRSHPADRAERYDAFPSWQDAVQTFATELVNATGEPNDAIHEVEQVVVIFETFAACAHELMEALRFVIWTIGMSDKESQLYKDAQTRSNDGTHRYDGTDPDIPF